VTFWVPILKLDPDMGLMRVSPGSHKKGLVPFRQFEEGYEPFIVRDIKKFTENEMEVMVKDDEILVFNQYVVHRSGTNLSEKCRVSIQLRYNDFATMNDNFSTFTPVHSKQVLAKQQELLKNWEK
jgi:ectoine hydroxylase-related dioxygenase (phytanoyl-CoA dioxygenase family)